MLRGEILISRKDKYRHKYLWAFSGMVIFWKSSALLYENISSVKCLKVCALNGRKIQRRVFMRD